MRTIPTWLYHKDGRSVIVSSEAELDSKLNEGWKDSPAKFEEEDEVGKENDQSAPVIQNGSRRRRR